MRRLLISIFLATISLNANALNILLTGVHPGRDPVGYLQGLGHTVTSTVYPWTWGSNFDYSAYDLVVFGYGGGNPADIPNLVAAVEAGEVGVVFLRGEGAEATARALGILQNTTTAYPMKWQLAYANLNVVDNSHYITQGAALGLHDLGHKYMSYIPEPGVNTTVLATGLDGAALVVHNNLRVAVNANYAHLDGLANETAFGRELTERTLQWAAGASLEPEVTQVDIDIQPFDATNAVSPSSDNPIIVAVHSTSIGDGDAADFDATQVDATTLKFAIGEAPNVAVTPWVQDLDGDSDSDVMFAFRTQDTGIFCGDTEATLTGETYAGDAFTGTDSLTTTDCIDTGCHP